MVDLHSPSDWLRTIARNAKRLLVFIVGVAVLAAGVAMLALPGPGVVVIIVGLVILGTEFAWAERMLERPPRRPPALPPRSRATRAASSRSPRRVSA